MDIKEKIYKAFKKKKESIIVDLFIVNYNSANFYIGLVFNHVINKFKVAFIPIDAIESNDKIEDYLCYQFIFPKTVEYILDTLNSNEKELKNKNLDRSVKTNTSFYIELGLISNNNCYLLSFTQFIDREFEFLFDIIVILFEHSPNIMHELCSELLEQFNTEFELFKYNESLDFNLFEDPVETIFSEEIIKNNKYKFYVIQYLEKIDEKFYGVINNKRFIISDSNNETMNIYSGNEDSFGDEVFIIIKAIRENKFKRFNKIEVTYNETINKKYILYVYDIDFDSRCFIVFNNLLDKKINFGLMENKCLKVIYCNKEFKDKIINYLNNKYVSNKAKELIDYIFENEDK